MVTPVQAGEDHEAVAIPDCLWAATQACLQESCEAVRTTPRACSPGENLHLVAFLLNKLHVGGANYM